MIKEIFMRKVFSITSISPFDLMRWGRDATYNKLSEEYNTLFNKNIEILEAELNFIKNELRVLILTSRQN
jgi:hypothetical protein